MPQQPNTGDAGSRRRPRAMDKQRRAAWNAAFKKLNAGREVWEMPAEEHAALLRPGLFEGLDEVAAQEEAAYVVRYWLHGFDWSPIPPRGPTIAPNWLNIESEFGAQRAEETLRNDIQASTHDPRLSGGAGWHRGVASRTGPAVSRAAGRVGDPASPGRAADPAAASR